MSAHQIEGERILRCGCILEGYGSARRILESCALGRNLKDEIKRHAVFGADPRVLAACESAYNEHLRECETGARPWPLSRTDGPPPKDGLTRSDVTKCRACGAPIVFLKHPGTNRPHPIDAETCSSSDVFWERGKGQISHFKTCPNAEQFRRDPS